jgi:hypothetical protein
VIYLRRFCRYMASSHLVPFKRPCPSLVSWLNLAEDNLDEDLELLRELALEPVAEEAYLDDLAQKEGRNCLPEPDNESWYKEA